RDLENFRKLHQIGELSVGIIITRGTDLQIELKNVFQEFLLSIYPFDADLLVLNGVQLSQNAKDKIDTFLKLPKDHAIAKTVNMMYTSKYGPTHTNMKKLLLRISRGLGNPTPLVLIGIGKQKLLM
ncbi:MAG TPA: BglII/BstYI family type II restriction endonuclease, partial [Chitinophagaceae bacterium]|nr:BglII/BstYI family type II restriction endonuclease [Chitinophagaceae bacterium]